jgi:hypothetical protein
MNLNQIIVASLRLNLTVGLKREGAKNGLLRAQRTLYYEIASIATFA